MLLDDADNLRRRWRRWRHSHLPADGKPQSPVIFDFVSGANSGGGGGGALSSRQLCGA